MKLKVKHPMHYTERGDSLPCAEVDIDLFFPLEGGRRPKQYEAAMTACSVCPVKNECFDYAIHTDVLGIWAGTTYDQRKSYRRTHGITPVPLDEAL